MVQTATVTKLLTNGRALVEVRRQSACGHDCSKCGGGCSELVAKSTVTAEAENRCRAQVGDTVQVESDSRQILGIAAIVYFVPLITFFVGYFLGSALKLSEGGAIAAGVLGFALGLIPAFLTNRRIKREQQVSFRITAILDL